MFFGVFAALAVSGVGICGRDLDFESLFVAAVCAFCAGFCAKSLSWGATLAFAVPFAVLCLFVRAANNDRNYPVIIAAYTGLVLLISLYAKPVAPQPEH